MTITEFQNQIKAGIPDVLPPVKPYEKNIQKNLEKAERLSKWEALIEKVKSKRKNR